MSAEEPGYRDWQGWDEAREGPITYHVSDSVPSKGSSGHAAGTCRPCAWFHKPGGCRNSQGCSHCHLCPANARKKSKGQGKAKGDGKDRRLEEEVVPAPEAELSPVPPIDPSSGPRCSRGSELHGMPGKQRCRPCLLLWTTSGCREGEDCEHCHICVPEQFSQPPPPPPGGPPADRQPMPQPMPQPMSQPVPQPVLQPVAQPATGAASTGPGGPGPTLAIQLADRIQEPPPLPVLPALPSVTSVVLGTAPPGTMGRPTPAVPPRVPPGTLRSSPPRSAKCNSMVSQFQMGLLESMYCDNCGAQLCICFPGGYGFSQQLAPRGEANGFRNGAGDVQGLQSVKDLMKSGEELRGQENEVPQKPLCSGSCTPCLEMIQSRYCSAGDSCQYCHQCLDRRKNKKIGNMSLKKSQKVGDNANMWL